MDWILAKTLPICSTSPWTLRFFENSCSCFKTPGNRYDRHLIFANPAGLTIVIRNVSQTDHPQISHPVGVDIVYFYRYKILYGFHAKVGFLYKILLLPVDHHETVLLSFADTKTKSSKPSTFLNALQS